MSWRCGKGNLPATTARSPHKKVCVFSEWNASAMVSRQASVFILPSSLTLYMSKLSFSLGGLLAALLASTCCIAPLLSGAILLGLSTSQITLLASIKPYLMAVSLGLILYSLIQAYRPTVAARCCNAGNESAQPKGGLAFFGSKVFLWSSAVVAVVILALPYTSFSIASNTDDPHKSQVFMNTNEHEAKTSFILTGMNKECCVSLVENALREGGGIIRMEADISTQRINVFYDSTKTDITRLETALNNTPYKATLIR